MALDKSTLTACKKRLIQMHYESRVGHLGGNLSAFDAMLTVFHDFMSDDCQFVLSKGHAAGALYICLWAVGLLDEKQLESFHGEATLLPGHPPSSGLQGCQFATGSLGHGLSLASGAALGRQIRIAPGRVFCMTSDGEWQEGSTWEALIFAVHHQLTNLCILVDHNELQGFGSVAETASMSPLWERLEGFDIESRVIDGHDIEAIRAALAPAQEKVRVIFLKTTKGIGLDGMENTVESHYLPPSQEVYEAAIKLLDAQ